jgi:probable F420-dependent oxidoreductase
MAKHKFRFGVQFVGARDGEDWARKVREAESLGYGTVALSDHFGDQLAPVPGLMAAAAASPTIRVGACVFDNDFKHPVVLAKEIASMDILCGGRVELGIGAGWMHTDYEQSGIPFDSAGVRIDKLAEAITVMKGLFGSGPVNFEGKHYQVKGLDGKPKPKQKPYPPFFIGGGGKRMLGLAAREADIVGINFNLKAGSFGVGFGGRDATAEATAQKIAWVREAAGDRFDHIEFHLLVFFTALTQNEAQTKQVLAQVANHFAVAPEDAPEVPYIAVGTVDRLVEMFEERREKFGFSYITVGEHNMQAFAPVVQRLSGR